MAIQGDFPFRETGPSIRVTKEDIGFSSPEVSRLALAIAQDAATMALQEYRQTQKRGRSDQGHGSPQLGMILFRARERFKETQDSVSAFTTLHATTIGKIETGDRGMSMTTFAKLAKFYDEQFIDEVIDYYASL